jgi:hypothetical protein
MYSLELILGIQERQLVYGTYGLLYSHSKLMELLETMDRLNRRQGGTMRRRAWFHQILDLCKGMGAWAAEFGMWFRLS